MNRLLCISGAVLALSAFAYAQRPGTPGAPTSPSPSIPNTPSPSPSPGSPTNPRTLPTQPFPQDQTMQPGMQRPIFLSGKVMLDDGTAPSEPVAIQRVCNANPLTEAYTDSKGRFSFELGKRLGLVPDASEQAYDMGAPGMGMPSRMGSGGMGGRSGMGGMNPEQMLMGCELRAYLPGFRSDSVNLSTRKFMDNPEVGTIILHRLANVEGMTISATTAMAPKDAKKAFEKGFSAAGKKKWEEAQREFEKAVDVYPKFAAAWYELGRVQQIQGNTDGARKSYAQALAADAKYVKPYAELANLDVREGKWEDVKADTSRLLSLNPVDYPQAWFYNGVANYQLHDMEAAEKSAREAMKIDTAHRIPKISQLLGVVLAQKQDYAGAAQNLKDYLQFAPNAPDAETVRKQLATIEQQSQASAQPKP